MLDALLAWVESLPAAWAGAWVFGAAAIEYVVPPLPGDTLVLFGFFLAAHTDRSVVLVYVAATAGAVGGSLLAWGFGRLLGGDPARWPPMLQSPDVRGRIDALRARYARNAGWWLLANRFLPAFRAVFFVAAGIADVSAGKVVVFGGLSAAIWNALLLGLGWTAAAEFSRLRRLSEGYAVAVAVGASVLALLWVSYRWLRARDGRPDGPRPRSSRPSSPEEGRGSSGRSTRR